MEAIELVGGLVDWFNKVIEGIVKAKDQQKLSHVDDSIGAHGGPSEAGGHAGE